MYVQSETGGRLKELRTSCNNEKVANVSVLVTVIVSECVCVGAVLPPLLLPTRQPVPDSDWPNGR